MCRAFTLGCLCLWMCSFALRAQVSLDWTSRYSGPEARHDSVRAIAVDAAGNAHVTAAVDPAGSPDIVTIKYNSAGSRVWTATWGAPEGMEFPTDIEVDTAGNVYVYGLESLAGPGLVLIKYNASGTEQWVRRFRSLAASQPAQMALDSAGNTYLTGTSGQAGLSEFLTLKYDSGGSLLWSRAYSVTNAGILTGSGALAVDSSGQAYVSGSAYAHGLPSMFILKYDSDGTLLWSVTENPISTYDGRHIALDGAGNLYVGAMGPIGPGSGFIVFKYSSAGQLLWSGTYRGPTPSPDFLTEIAVDLAGNVFLTGTSSGAASEDIVTVKFNADGTRQWVSRFNNPLGNSTDVPRGVATDSAGSVYVGGYTYGGASQHDFLALKYDATGNQKWTFSHDEAGSPDFLYDFALGPAGSIFLTGSASYLDTGTDILTAKLEQQAISGLPEVLAGPQDIEVIAGRSDVTFSVSVESPTSVTYQWRFNGRNIPGATEQSYTITAAGASEAGEYSVRVSNAVGVTATPEARLTVHRPPTVSIFTTPTNVVEGRTVVLDASVDGDQPIRFQWRFNDMDIVGQTNQQLRLTSVTTNQTGSYVLVARNPWGDVMSNPVAVTVFPSGPIDRWTWRSPLPQGNELTAIAYGNGRYVAVGDDGTVIVSSNGRDWSVHSADYGSFTSIAFGDGLFVAAAQGVLYTSVDGITWTNRIATLPYHFSRIVFGAGRFVATGNALLSSDDGISWVEHGTNSAFGSAVAFTYGNGVFMIHSWNGLLVSSNGIDWVQTPAGPSFPAIAAGNGVFVAHNYNVLLRSTNGLDWETVYTLTNNNYLNGLSFVNGQFHALGNVLLTSADGRTWSQRIAAPRTEMQLTSAAGVPGQTIVVGDEGVIFESNDGVTFAQVGGGTRNNLRALIYANDRFTITGNDGLIWRSDDGLTFSPVPSPSTNNLRAIAYGSGTYVIVGEAGAVLTSRDGLAWESLNLVTNGLYGIKFANGHFTVVGESGRVLVSTNARDWTATLANTGERLQGIAYGAGLYVATGQRGYYAVSTNAVHWQAGRNDLMGYLESIVYTNGLFVAVGSNGRIFTSPDGAQWTPRITNNGQELESLIYVLGQFIAAGDRGTIMTSTNAIDWVEHRFLTRNSFRQIIYARGALWGVGNNEMVVKSGQLQPYVTLGSGPLSGRLIQVAAEPGQIVELQASDSLADWESLVRAPASAEGTLTHIDSVQRPRRFYRVAP